MKTAIATVSISGDLTEKLAAIAAAGFDGVEIFENDFLAFDGGPGEVGRMVRDHGLEISLFQPFRDFEGMPEPQRTRAFDRAERKFDVMQELGEYVTDGEYNATLRKDDTVEDLTLERAAELLAERRARGPAKKAAKKGAKKAAKKSTAKKSTTKKTAAKKTTKKAAAKKS